MLKLLGICVLFLSARIFYENILDKKETHIKKTEDIIMFINLVYINVIELNMPLPLAVSSLKFRISSFIDGFVEKFNEYCEKDKQKLPREAMVKVFSFLDADKKIKREAQQFLQVLVMVYKETTVNYKKTAVRECEKLLTEHKNNFEKNKKTAGALTFGLSSVLVIILI